MVYAVIVGYIVFVAMFDIFYVVIVIDVFVRFSRRRASLAVSFSILELSKELFCHRFYVVDVTISQVLALDAVFICRLMSFQLCCLRNFSSLPSEPDFPMSH